MIDYEGYIQINW